MQRSYSMTSFTIKKRFWASVLMDWAACTNNLGNTLHIPHFMSSIDRYQFMNEISYDEYRSGKWRGVKNLQFFRNA